MLRTIVKPRDAVQWARYLTEERERRRIKATFQQYVSPEVIEQVLNDPQRL